MLKKVFLISTLLGTFLFGEVINIAVAANVSYAIDELKREFKKISPETDVRVTLGSSGKLTAQIRNGAPYQLFMSANMRYPEALYRDNLTATKPIVYAQGGLALISRKEIDFSRGLELLRDKSIRKIAIANPNTAPYGKASLEAMKNSGVLDDVENRFVFGESISQTLTYSLTASDIGFVAKSSLYSSKMEKFKEGLNWISVDQTLYKPINQGVVILKRGEKSSEVWKFYSFILGKKAEEIFKNYGYTVP